MRIKNQSEPFSPDFKVENNGQKAELNKQLALLLADLSVD